MTLDQAVREAADRIDERIEAGSKIALLNFTSSSDQFSAYVLDELTANLVDSGKLTIIDRQEIDLIRGEMNFQMSGEVSDDSMQALGQLLGAQSIVSGSLTSIGSEYRIVIRVLNVQTAAVAVQYRADIANDSRVQALLSGGRSGGTATASVSGEQAQIIEPATSSAPKNGTYTFWPRPQATQAGIPVNAYLDRVEVRGNFVTFYFEAVPTGTSGSWQAAGGWWNDDSFRGRLFLQNLETSNRPPITPANNGFTGTTSFVAFENVTGNRFSLTDTSTSPQIVFDEIILGEPD